MTRATASSNSLRRTAWSTSFGIAQLLGLVGGLPMGTR
jgi:hypothetical protein